MEIAWARLTQGRNPLTGLNLLQPSCCTARFVRVYWGRNPLTGLNLLQHIREDRRDDFDWPASRNPLTGLNLLQPIGGGGFAWKGWIGRNPLTGLNLLQLKALSGRPDLPEWSQSPYGAKPSATRSPAPGAKPPPPPGRNPLTGLNLLQPWYRISESPTGR